MFHYLQSWFSSKLNDAVFSLRRSFFRQYESYRKQQ